VFEPDISFATYLFDHSFRTDSATTVSDSKFIGIIKMSIIVSYLSVAIVACPFSAFGSSEPFAPSFPSLRGAIIAQRRAKQ